MGAALKIDPPANRPPMRYIIVDLDGTVADSRHRSQHLHVELGKTVITREDGAKGVILQQRLGADQSVEYQVHWQGGDRNVGELKWLSWADFMKYQKIDWSEWEATTHLDTLIEPTAWLLRAIRPFMLKEGSALLFLTSRGHTCRQQTIDWLNKHELFMPDYGDVLLMRDRDDPRRDTIFKTEVLRNMRAQGAEFVFALDDKGSIAKAFRDMGIFVMHVADYD